MKTETLRKLRGLDFKSLQQIGEVFIRIKNSVERPKGKPARHNTRVSIRVMVNPERKSWWQKAVEFVKEKFKKMRHA